VPTPGLPARAARHGGDATLLAAAAIAAATSWSTIATGVNLAVLVAGSLLLGLLIALRAALGVPSPWALVAALAVGAVPQIWRPPVGNVLQGPLFPLAIGLGLLAGALLALAALRPAARRGAPLAALATTAAAQVLMVQASARPAIDVWVILQQATSGLLHGRNPYAMRFSGVPAGQTGDCFNYLPVHFLAALPGRVALGDVRYGELLVLLTGVALLGWALGRGAAGRATLALPLLVAAVCLPGTLRVAQQAWGESLVLGCLLAAVALLAAGRAWLAVVPLGLALATKQHVALVLPLWALWPSFGWRRAAAAAGLAAAVCLPWLLAGPGRFYGCTVRFFLDLPARPDSLSLWRFVPGALRAPLVAALVVGAYLLAVRRLDRSLAGLVLGCALVFVAFDLANKQSFENQWLLACQLVVAALACRAAAAGARPAAAGEERSARVEAPG
jgi:hypothetical protein